MKLLLLKILLQRRARDEGFTLPMVIAIGLVMLLLGTINIVKSSEENISAISQNSSADALAVAEVGITKYRELLNQNRILTVYNHDQWDDADADTNDGVSAQACNDMTTAPKAINPSTGLLEPIWTGTATKPNDDAYNADDKDDDDDDNWWEINEDFNGDGDTTDDGEFIGEYRLVSYEYDIDGSTGDADNNGILDDTDDNNNFDILTDADTEDDDDTKTNYQSITKENDKNDDGESDAVGILTVQGRSPDGSSVAQIEVEIPLRINDLENFAPVLWVGSGAIATPGTLSIPNADDNIVLKSSGAGCSTPTAIAGNSNVISDPRSLPAIDAAPTDTNKKNTIGAIDTTGSRVLLPRPLVPSDNKDDQGRFPYEVTTITVANNNLVTDGTAKVALYATDNITITGAAGTTRTIGNSNAVNQTNFNNGSTTNTSVSSQNLEIYLAGNKTININPNGGTVNIEAFIHAPDSTVNITGSGTVNINGALWVKNFNNSSTATPRPIVNIRSDKTDTTTASEPSYKFYKTSATMTPRPLTSTPTNWVREEVQ